MHRALHHRERFACDLGGVAVTDASEKMLLRSANYRIKRLEQTLEYTLVYLQALSTRNNSYGDIERVQELLNYLRGDNKDD